MMKKTFLALSVASLIITTQGCSGEKQTTTQAPSTEVTQAVTLVAKTKTALDEATAASAHDQRKLAQLAYEYAFSIDEAYKYFYETVVKTDYPLNRFQNLRILADDKYTAHPTINNDTLHLMGWMDLAAEPVIITVPDHDEGRYWLFHTMNMQHFTDSAFGSPDRGSQGGIFMYAVEGWKGEIPASIDEVIYVEHPLVKMMGRIMDLGGDDSAKAQKLMDQWSVRPLSAFLGQKGPDQTVRDYPDPDNTNWVERTKFILSEGTMREHDADLLTLFSELEINVAAGQPFTEKQVEMVAAAEKDGFDHIKNAGFDDSRDVLGTREEMTAVPSFQHAYGTLMGQWGLPAKHTMYAGEFFDSEGTPLDGSKYDYTVTFDAPPVDSFWSYTAYSGITRLMEHNALNRHSRGDRTLKPNEDGSYTIYMSANTEGQADNPNFLPIPDHSWYAILRMYTPKDDVRKDVWKSTPFTRVEKK